MRCPRCGRELSGTSPDQGSCPFCEATEAPINATVDVPIAPPSSDSELAAAPPRLDATVDIPVVLPESSTTPAAPRLDATVDIPVVPQEPQRPLSATAVITQTVEVDSTGKLAGQDSKAHGPVSVSGGTDVRMVEQLWRKSISADARPGMTIKQDTRATSTGRSLMVQQRSMREPNAAAAPSLTDYELLEVLGEGGMGVVYTARQASIDRIVAVKMLKTGMKDDESHRGKFFSEAVVTGDLEHPNIVPIYDMGANESGALFYSMKRVHGTPWHEVIAAKSLAENLRILMSVSDAVAFAHVRGIVHRDLKPENVMLGDFGEVLVMDWGIAMATAAFGKSDSILQTSGVGGTPAYMAPELASGQIDRIGPASDIYLLGAILYEILTGNPPHTGKNVMQCLVAAARNEIQPTDKSGELMDIARKAMATSIEDRYASVLDFQEAIRQYQAHSESIVLSSRAEEDLARSRETRDYQDFSRALFAFQEAVALWDGNGRAVAGIVETQAAYAACALAKGDYDLGLSLLDPGQPKHASLHAELTAAQHERDSRALRLKKLKRLAAVLAAVSFTILAVALVLILQQKREADQQRGIAVQQRDVADQQRAIAETERKKAEDERQRAEQQQRKAEEQTQIAQTERQRAEQQQRYAEQQRAFAVVQRRKAEEASYVAQIGLAAERIASNAFLDADRLLQFYEQPGMTQPRNWEWGYLRRLCQLAHHTLDASTRVECALYSPDGRYLIAGTVDGMARIWDAATYQLLAVLPHAAPVRAAAMTQDGLHLATAGDDRGDITIWKLDFEGNQHALLRTLSGHRDAVLSLSLSPNEDSLLSSSQDETARIWDWETGTEKAALRGHFGPVWSARYSPDGRRIVTAGEDGTVRVWSSEDGTRVTRFRGHQGAVYAAAFSDNGEFVASGGSDQRVLVWEPDRIEDFDFDGLETRLVQASTDPATVLTTGPVPSPVFRTLEGHTAEIRAIGFRSQTGDQQGTFVLSAGHDNTVRVWNLNASDDDADRVQTFRGHGGWVRAAAFHPQGQFVVSGAYDSQLKVWDVRTYEEERVLRGQDSPIAAASFSADGQRVITAGRDGTAILWDWQNGQVLAHLSESAPGDDQTGSRTDRNGPADAAARKLVEGHEFLVTRAAFFPPGDPRLLTTAGDATVRIWNLITGGQIRRLDRTGQRGALALADDGKSVLTGSDDLAAQLWDVDREDDPPELLVGHRFEITAVAISPGGDIRQRRLLTGDANGHAKMWTWDASQKRWSVSAELIGHLPGYAITAARFLPDGSQLLTACEDHTVMRWNAETGQRLTTGTLKHPGAVRDLDLTPDGRHAVTVCTSTQTSGEIAGEGFLLIHWQLEPVRELRTLLVTDEVVTSAVFDAQARGVLVASMTPGGASAVKWWDLADGQYRPFWFDDRGRGSVWAAFAAPDGAQVLTVGGSYARLWDAETGQSLQTLSPHGPLTYASWSPSDTLAATADVDGAVKIWSVAPQAEDYGRVRSKIPGAHRKDDRAYPVNSAVFGPVADSGDAWLLTAGDDGSVKLWDLQAQPPREYRTFQHPAAVRRAVFSPDAALVATACLDGSAWIWNVQTGASQALGEQRAHELAVQCAVFSPDGKRLATGGDDNIVKLWDVERMMEITVLKGHTASITSVAFSLDGRRIVSGSQDAMVKVWDAASGQQVLNLKRHAAEITAVAISHDGRHLLTASSDRLAIIATSVNISPTITTAEDPLIYSSLGQPVRVDQQATLDDPDAPHFGGGRLTVRLVVADGEPGTDEQIAIEDDGQAAEGIRVENGSVLFESGASDGLVEIGRLVDENRHPHALVVVLTERATKKAVQSLLRHINYTSRTPLKAERQIHFQLDDGQGGISHPAARILVGRQFTQGQ